MPQHAAGAPDHAARTTRIPTRAPQRIGLVSFERLPLRRMQVVATERGDALGAGGAHLSGYHPRNPAQPQTNLAEPRPAAGCLSTPFRRAWCGAPAIAILVALASLRFTKVYATSLGPAGDTM
jgi:hypothetical protein